MLEVRNYKKKKLYDLTVSKENSVEIKELKEGEKASILSDTMFKAMFYHTKRIKYSAKFISYYLDISYEELLKNIKLTKNELDKEYKNTKGERSDYVAEMNGVKINIEVNNNSNYTVMERNMEYAHRLYSEKVRIGDDYKYKYNQVIQFNLNNFSFIGNDKIVDIYSIQNDEGLVLNDKIIFINIYVPNLRKKMYNQGIENLSEEERYLLGLIEPDINLSKELGGEIDIMIEYVNEAGEVTMGTNFGESYDKEWALKDEERREGIKEGRREGLKVGREEGIKSSAINLLKNGASLELISKSLGYSIEKLEEMKKEINNY